MIIMQSQITPLGTYYFIIILFIFLNRGRCVNCKSGEFSSSGATVCKPCALGKWSEGGAAQCTDCTAGQKRAEGDGRCVHFVNNFINAWPIFHRYSLDVT